VNAPKGNPRNSRYAGSNGKLLFNVASRDEALREEDCRPNLLHTMPSRSMLTDALAQFFLKKHWQN
jgi:hypothetical protein